MNHDIYFGYEVNAEGEPKVEANNFRIAFTSKKHFFPIAMAILSKEKGEDFIWFILV
jgi:hypothetical protein